VVSMICSPEAVVMGFPVWADAAVGANAAAAMATAIAAIIEIIERWNIIPATFRFSKSAGCLPQGGRRYHPVRPAQ
jgi:hypothetical protein